MYKRLAKMLNRLYVGNEFKCRYECRTALAAARTHQKRRHGAMNDELRLCLETAFIATKELIEKAKAGRVTTAMEMSISTMLEDISSALLRD